VQAEQIGRDDLVAFTGEKAASYDQLMSLFLRRRSIRRFKDKPVADDVVQKILEAAQQAPAGLPPSTVDAWVINGKEKVRAFAFDFLDEAGRMAWLFSKVGIWAFRPFMSAVQHKKMREKIVPLYRGLLGGRRDGKDFLFYDAPLVMIFTGESDPVDAMIAATYAMAAAESLGLGSCMIGTVIPMLPSVRKVFLEKYSIKMGRKDGMAIIFGYFDMQFRRGIRRRFENIQWKK
jgi:nitroreductase